jgi:hypothetical protein
MFASAILDLICLRYEVQRETALCLEKIAF